MKYTHKPIEVEAVQWTGSNIDEIKRKTKKFVKIINQRMDNKLYLKPWENLHLIVDIGSWIILGKKLDVYSNDQFNASYEKSSEKQHE